MWRASSCASKRRAAVPVCRGVVVKSLPDNDLLGWFEAPDGPSAGGWGEGGGDPAGGAVRLLISLLSYQTDDQAAGAESRVVSIMLGVLPKHCD